MSTKRGELLRKTKEAIKNSMIPFKLKSERHELNGWILKKEGEVSALELEIEELKSAETLTVDKILETVDTLEVTKVRLQQGHDLYTELYSDIKKAE